MELMDALPAHVSKKSVLEGRYKTAEVLLLAMKTLLPTEDRARVDLLDDIERPANRPPRNFRESWEMRSVNGVKTSSSLSRGATHTQTHTDWCWLSRNFWNRWFHRTLSSIMRWQPW